MNQELKDLLALVKQSDESAREVINTYFDEMGWSMLKDEWDRMTEVLHACCCQMTTST